ncbi:hypothetical protein KKH23_04955 [Patescibacteria group bacterium]|nr:hypothetical protein [Patescibacteria group bacterium]
MANKPSAKRVSASEVRKTLTELRKAWGWSPSDIISLLRGGGSSGKGSEYERGVCKALSRWWTGGERDDVFWRTSGSGARAKLRGRGGQDTAGQYGDVAATDPIGAPFIDVFTAELKRGYSEHTFQDLVDRVPKAGVQVWEYFFAQIIESAEQAGSYTWLLITRRDRRRAIVWMPFSAMSHLRIIGAFSYGYPYPFLRMRVPIRPLGQEPYNVSVCCMALEDWLAGVQPEHVEELAENVCHGNVE